MAVMVMACAGIGAMLLSRTDDVTRDLAYRASPARSEALGLQAALIDQETGVRGYLLTRDPRFLSPYEEGRKAEGDAARRIAPLLEGDRRLVDDLAAVRDAGRRWRRDYAEPLIKAAQGKQAPDTTAIDRSKRAFDRIRGLIDVQNRHLREARDHTRHELRRTERVRDLALTAMLAVFLLSGVVLAVLLHTAVGRPLAVLRAASRRVAGGEFEHRIPAQGPRDIHEVAEVVEEMRTRIVAELATSREQQGLLSRQAADLDAQTAELRRSNAELEQFAYVASHDLQEPLRKVASFCQLLEKRYGDKLDERGAQYIDFAVDGAKRMQVLINDLLTFSRVGRLNDTSEAVPLGRVLDKAIVNLAAAVEESEARIERPGELPEVLGDPTLLTMLWQNLVGNAVKFRHPDRPPVLRITAEPEESGTSWRFSVTDNGIGIGEEFAEKVFVIFQRLHGRDVYSGTGIGLALCKKIVEHHGGSIWIDTGHTEGARVRFTLPTAPAAEAPETTDAAPAAGADATEAPAAGARSAAMEGKPV
ncbi:sensor histidine kinase [Wenjunlia tyrosinilytica]|nr:sensor histidine kinase [Wenjunlia tyrosinilytica]